MKGIILAGGNGTRLNPLTHVISKQLLPVYDKPMIYYPLSVLMLAGIRDILIICKENDLKKFKSLFGDGKHLGVSISYEVQDEPRGIAEAFLIGEKFISGDDVCLILGDNLIYGTDLPLLLKSAIKKISISKGGLIFAHHVKNPKDYGVIEVDSSKRVVKIVEKPKKPKSNLASIGLYMYDNTVVEIAKKIKPSYRGELEITSVNNVYVKNTSMNIEILGRGFAWFDTGSFESLLKASNFVNMLEERQAMKIACIEEIAYRKKYITKDDLENLTHKMTDNDYCEYLLRILDEK